MMLFRPVTATRDAHTERLLCVRRTASLLYNKTVANIEYGRRKMEGILKRNKEKR